MANKGVQICFVFSGMFLASETRKGFGMELEMEMEWTGNGMEWNGKREKSEEWEDEWIMIPPTPLNCPWLVMTGLNSFYFIYLVYNR